MRRRIFSKRIVIVITVLTSLILFGCGIAGDSSYENEIAIDIAPDVLAETVVNDDNKEIVDFIETDTEKISYSYTDVSATMFATSIVNIRDNPSIEGNKIGELSFDQEVIVNGQCNETGWYRIDCDGVTGFVNEKYLSAKKQISPAKKTTNSSASRKANFSKEKAMAVLDLINAERAANGLGQLSWDENIYNFACIRAQQITANFAHEYDSPYGENIGYQPHIQTAEEVHMQYFNSPGHHQNYLTGSYVCGAIAIYEVDGVSYHVELFSTTTENNYGNVTAQQSQEAQEWGATVVATWTASNGIVFEILSDGNVGMHYGGYSDEQINEALAEFMNYMGFQY